MLGDPQHLGVIFLSEFIPIIKTKKAPCAYGALRAIRDGRCYCPDWPEEDETTSRSDVSAGWDFLLAFR